MANLGDVLGGVAAQRNRRIEQERLTRGVDLQERGLELGEQQFGFQQQQAEAQQQQDARKSAAESMANTIALFSEQVTSGDGDEKQLSGTFNALSSQLDMAEDAGAIAEQDLAELRSALDFAAQGQSPEEAAIQAGDVAATTQLTKLETVLGRPPTEEERLRVSGAAPPAPPASPAIVKLLDEKDATDAALFAARSAGDVPEAERLQARSSALNGAIKQAQLENVAPDLVTTSTRAEAEKQVRSSASALEAVGGLSRLLEERPDQFGFTGAIKGLVNKTFAQAIPDLFSTNRQIAESAVEAVRSNLQRAVTDDSRFTNEDREFIFRLFPSTGPFETQEAAEIKVKTLALLFARRLASASETPGVELPVELANFTLADLIESVQSGIITKVEGADIAKSLFADELRALVGEQ